MAVAALEQTVNRTAVPDESLLVLLDVLQKMEECDARGDGFNRGLAAERATSIAILGAPQKLSQALTVAGGHVSPEQREQILARIQKSDKFPEDQNYLDQTFQLLLATRKDAFPERLKADDLVRQRVSEAADKKLAGAAKASFTKNATLLAAKAK